MYLHFELTCQACPEQYDVFDEHDKIVAYVRLRWGHLRIYCPDVGGTLIYEQSFDDEYKGIFNDEEREFYFPEIHKAIENHYSSLVQRRES